jgi:hypothetical protein
MCRLGKSPRVKYEGRSYKSAARLLFSVFFFLVLFFVAKHTVPFSQNSGVGVFTKDGMAEGAPVRN